jgi:hypothetical protein
MSASSRLRKSGADCWKLGARRADQLTKFCRPEKPLSSGQVQVEKSVGHFERLDQATAVHSPTAGPRCIKMSEPLPPRLSRACHPCLMSSETPSETNLPDICIAHAVALIGVMEREGLARVRRALDRRTRELDALRPKRPADLGDLLERYNKNREERARQSELPVREPWSYEISLASFRQECLNNEWTRDSIDALERAVTLQDREGGNFVDQIPLTVAELDLPQLGQLRYVKHGLWHVVRWTGESDGNPALCGRPARVVSSTRGQSEQPMFGTETGDSHLCQRCKWKLKRLGVPICTG